MSLVAVGLTHHRAPLSVLERATVADEDVAKVLADLVSRDHLSEVVVISTCNRFEVYAMAERFHGAVDDVCDFLVDRTGASRADLDEMVDLLFDDGAARHLFRVASGADSAVIGEHEILGQVRRSWERATVEGACGRHLHDVFRHAVAVGKRARTETSIGRHTASVSAAAVEMAAAHLDGLVGRSVMVLGAGEMGAGIAANLHAAGVAGIGVVNRTWARAAEVADAVGGRPIPLQELPAALAETDLLITSTGAASMMLEFADLEPVAATRRGRPLLVVDVAVPRDVDPGVGRLDGVTLLDMDDLREFSDQGMQLRRQELDRVCELIEESVLRWSDENNARIAAPLVTALRSFAEEVRSTELARFASRLDGLDQRQREAVEALTAGIVGKLLHDPTVRLKDAAGSARGERLAEALRDLFDL